MSYQYNSALKNFRAISHLLRRNIRDGKVATIPIVESMIEEIRKHDITDQRICRAPQELNFIGESYRTYLESGEEYRTLYTKHYGKGEKSVQESANIVGLKLPEPAK